MNIYTISFTDNGAKLEVKVSELLKEHSVKTFASRLDMEDVFRTADIIIFISAVGIAVRFIAPFVKSKDKDPAVIVLDEAGKYVIPILSSHLGGGNKFALMLASSLNAECVITSATDINNVFAVDVWSKENDCKILDIGFIKNVSSELLSGGEVGFYSDYERVSDLPKGLVEDLDKKIGISISNKAPFPITLRILPKVYSIGVGCRKGIRFDILEEVVTDILIASGIDISRVSVIASVTLKAKEEALLKLAKEWHVPLVTFSTRELADVVGNFTESEFVKEVTGVGNICERAAVKAHNGELIVKKHTKNGVTVAVAKHNWVCKF